MFDASSVSFGGYEVITQSRRYLLDLDNVILACTKLFAVSHNSGTIGELLFGKIRKNVKTENLLQIKCSNLK
jgi:hypothetical protein